VSLACSTRTGAVVPAGDNSEHGRCRPVCQQMCDDTSFEFSCHPASRHQRALKANMWRRRLPANYQRARLDLLRPAGRRRLHGAMLSSPLHRRARAGRELQQLAVQNLARRLADARLACGALPRLRPLPDARARHFGRPFARHGTGVSWWLGSFNFITQST